MKLQPKARRSQQTPMYPVLVEAARSLQTSQRPSPKPALCGQDRLSRFVLGVFRVTLLESLLRIGYRRGNHISAARPFSEVDNAAAVTAERKIRVGVLNGFFADGAAEFDDTLARHTIDYRIFATRS